MAGLDDLLGSTLSLEDFSEDPSTKVEVKNAPSNLHLAAHVSILSDGSDDVESMYQTTVADLDTGESTIEDLVSMSKLKNFGKNKQALIEYLADPSVSDEEKQAASLGVLDIENKNYHIRNTLSLEALEADIPNENLESELVRVSLSDAISEVNDWKAQSQYLLNREVLKNDQGAVGNYVDIFEYFVPFVESKFATDVLDGMRNGEGWAFDEAFTMLGSSKTDLKDMVNSIPAEDRLEVTAKLLDVISNSSSIVIPDENEYAKVDFLRTVLEDGYYEDGDKWVDNAVSVLDMVSGLGVVGKALKKAGGILKVPTISMTEIRNAVRNSVRTRVQPTSASQNVKDVNVDRARALHEAVAQDATDEASGALYGSTRTEAIANDLMPEVASVDGSVRAKVAKPDAYSIQKEGPAAEIMEMISNSGAKYYWQEEKVALRARRVNDMQAVDGISARKEMFQVESIPDGVKVKAVYGPADNGFSNPRDAVAMAKWALRDFGASEDNIQLLVRDGGRYVPTTIKELETMEVISDTAKKLMAAKGPKAAKNLEKARKSGLLKKSPPDYLIQVDHEYKFNPNDVVAWSEADVKYNIFDKAAVGIGKMGAGSLQRTVFDPASMIHPNIVKSANISVDQAAGLEKQFLDLADAFASKFTKLDKDRQAVLDDLIREANHRSLDFNYTQMVASGLTPEEIAALKAWREYWDVMYRVENRDLAKSLMNKGFKELVDSGSNTRLFVKPVARNQLSSTTPIYDFITDSIKFVSKTELDEIYANGGTAARLKQPMQVAEDFAEVVLVNNKSSGAYLKAITESTQILNYRPGYYTVRYTDPRFIVEVVRDHTGKELYQKAVATAGTLPEAELKSRRLSAVNGKEYLIRRDEKGLRTDTDTYWDLQQAKGRTAQRVRGKRLEDSTTTLDDPSQAPIMGPVDSMVLSAKSMAHRASSRDFIEVTKQRFINQFGDFMPEGAWGQKLWPSNVGDIKYRNKGSENPNRLGDARTTFEYINYLEAGYVNHMDDFYKAVMRRISDLAGGAGWSKAEKAFEWASNSRGPTGMAKNLAFNMYLATNPFRQLVIQSHQAIQLAANFPQWFLSARAVPEVIMLVSQQLGKKTPKVVLDSLGLTEDQAALIFKQWDRSGLSASIDKQNLLRGALADMADEVSRKDFKPLTFLRKVGFDAGENVNMMTAWLAHRDAAKRAGKNVDDLEVLDDIRAEARNYTYNMNAAGDMPYNQNAFAVLFQFMQVPHKALLSMTANRILTRQQKLRLFLFNGVMYSLPPAAMYSLFGPMLPEDPEMRDLVVNGLEGAMFNKFLSLTSGQETYIDWSGLAPIDTFGMYDFLHGIMTQDVGAIIASTPSGQLFMGNNPRLSRFVESVARYTNLIDDHKNPTTFGQVAEDFAMLSSGYSNLFKAAYAEKYAKKIQSLGGVTDVNVTTPEAIAQVFGFRSMDEANRQWVKDEIYKKSKDFEEDVKEWHKDMKRHLLKNNITSEEFEYAQTMTSEAWRVFGNDDIRAKQLIERLLQQDIADGDLRLYNQILKMHEIMPTEEVKVLFDAMPDLDPKTKEQAKNTLDYIQQLKDTNDGF